MTDTQQYAEDDAALVEATRAGRSQAFGLLYDRYAAVVRAICFDATRELAAAQDLSQETFLRAYRNLPRLRNADRFGPWLIEMTRHVCREWRRSEGRYRKRVQAVAHRSESHEQDDEQDNIQNLISQLPRREREALHLFYLQEHPADAAAKLLGLSRSGFYRALERAKERLRGLLHLPPRVPK
jgi:RNA polymerase sigma-70 factor (ECF subfamily)